MRDVLLGQSYYLRLDPKLWQARQPYPPLGTLYAAACLRERGRDVALFDAMIADSVSEWRAALGRERPRVAVIYEDSFNYLSKMCLSRMREAALEMIDAATALGCPIVVSGSDATDHPALYLSRGAAAVVIGEGELTLVDLVDALMAGTALDAVPGAATLDAAGAVRRGAARPFIRSLDELPLPAWDLVDVARYRALWRSRHGYHSMNLATTRGCPYHCNWCAKPIYGQRYGVRAPRAVVAEMAWLKRVYAPDHLWIVDDVFGLKPGWVEEFAARVLEADARIPFRCLMRADQVTPAVAAALASAGCRMVWMGAESGSQRVLDAMEKGQRIADIRTARGWLREAGIGVGFFLQFGYPGEGWADIEATLALVREQSPDDIGVSVSYPLPGTRFYDRVREELGQKQNWVDSSDLAMMYRGTFTPAFYRRLHRVVHHEFRARRCARALSPLARHPWRVRPWHLRQAGAWVYNRAILPVARRRLQRMARTAEQTTAASGQPPALSPAAAATPTRQDEWASLVDAQAPPRRLSSPW
jgi:anaerobic magnesium-protoporphyrin IX monomethyl ester cyclase